MYFKHERMSCEPTHLTKEKQGKFKYKFYFKFYIKTNFHYAQS